jgi:hypothetical protein
MRSVGAAATVGRMRRSVGLAHLAKCKSPKTYKHLKGGRYIFEVRALSPLGAGPVAERRFRI